MAVRSDAVQSRFGARIRSWRQYRKWSQLDLALAAGVSQRHVSWLETGRSRPSRSMVVRLAEALSLSLRDQNCLLEAAGFAALYPEQTIDATPMAPVTRALERMLAHHDPYPAIVVDRLWNTRLTNTAMERLLAAGGEDVWERIGDDGSRNLVLLTLHPEGLRSVMRNWNEAAPVFVRRLRRDVAASGDQAAGERLDRLERLAGLARDDDMDPPAPLLPILPIELEFGAFRLSLFSVISTIGTPQDVTTDELRVESFFPTDDESDAMLRAWSAPSG